MYTRILNFGHFRVPDPEYGDFKLNLFPFTHDGGHVRLPMGYKMWEQTFNKLLEFIPVFRGKYDHYVTIDSKFFTTPETLRREGVHVDGNYCVDPNFKDETWGGTRPTWGGTRYHPILKAISQFASPYDREIPVGDYISNDKGGILSVSSEVGCQGWWGHFSDGKVGAQGECSQMMSELVESRKVIFEKDTLYFMTSNTPHESLTIDKGKRRTFMRITLNHEFPNKSIFTIRKDGYVI